MDTFESLAAQASAALERKDWQKALRFWTAARDNDPANFWGHYWVAELQERVGDAEASARMLEELLAKGSERAVVLTRLVEVLLALKRTDRAFEHWKELAVMPAANQDRVDFLAWWIVRQRLAAGGFPPDPFALEPELLARLPAGSGCRPR